MRIYVNQIKKKRINKRKKKKNIMQINENKIKKKE